MKKTLMMVVKAALFGFGAAAATDYSDYTDDALARLLRGTGMLDGCGMRF